MQRFTALFSDVPVRVISQGEVDVQQLMKESAVLVTDYSSVGFDFSFLHRPILDDQFDQEQFLGRWGSHLDLDVRVARSDRLHGGGPDRPDRRDGRRRPADGPDVPAPTDRFLAHRDRRSSERIYQAALRAKSSSNWLRRMAATDIPTAGARYFRRSPAHFRRCASCCGCCATCQQTDSPLVLFESGVGRQYADSPRYVYEELLRRASDAC